MIRRPSRRGTLEMLGLIDQDFNEDTELIPQDFEVNIPAAYLLGGWMTSLVTCTSNFINIHFNKMLSIEEKSKGNQQQEGSDPVTLVSVRICQRAIHAGQPSLSLLRQLALEESASIIAWLGVLKIQLREQPIIEAQMLTRLSAALEILGNRPSSAERKKQEMVAKQIRNILEDLEHNKWGCLRSIVELMSSNSTALVRLISTWVFADVSAVPSVPVDHSIQTFQYTLCAQATNLGSFFAKQSHIIFETGRDLLQYRDVHDGSQVDHPGRTVRGSSTHSDLNSEPPTPSHSRSNSHSSIKAASGDSQGSTHVEKSKFSLKATLAGLVKRGTGSSTGGTPSPPSNQRRHRRTSKTSADGAGNASSSLDFCAPHPSAMRIEESTVRQPLPGLAHAPTAGSVPSTVPASPMTSSAVGADDDISTLLDPSLRRARSVSSLTREFGRPPPPPPPPPANSALEAVESAFAENGVQAEAASVHVELDKISQHIRVPPQLPPRKVKVNGSDSIKGKEQQQENQNTTNFAADKVKFEPPLLCRQSNKMNKAAHTPKVEQFSPPVALVTPVAHPLTQSTAPQVSTSTAQDQHEPFINEKKSLFQVPVDKEGNTEEEQLPRSQTSANQETAPRVVPPPIPMRMSRVAVVNEQSAAKKTADKIGGNESLNPKDSPNQSLPPKDSPNQSLPPKDSPNQSLPPKDSPNQSLPPKNSTNQSLPPKDSPNQPLPSRDSSNQSLPPRVPSKQSTDYSSLNTQSNDARSSDKRSMDQNPDKQSGGDVATRLPPTPPPRPPSKVGPVKTPQPRREPKDANQKYDMEQILLEVAPPQTLRYVPMSMPNLKQQSGVGPVATWRLPGEAEVLNTSQQHYDNAPPIPPHQTQPSIRASVVKKDMAMVTLAANSISLETCEEDGPERYKRPVSEAPSATALAQSRRTVNELQ